MVLLDDEAQRDRCLSLRRWGRRSEPQLFGSKRGERNFWEDLDGIRYDSLFIFDDVAWNFEPSELGAAFGLRQLDKLPVNYERRQRNFALYNDFLARHPDAFIPPRQLDGLDTAWLSYVFLIRPDAGFGRSDLQQFLEPRGIDTAHGLDRQRDPSADDAGRPVPSARRRAPERRCGHGARHAGPDGPRALGRRRGLRVRQHRRVPPGAAPGAS